MKENKYQILSAKGFLNPQDYIKALAEYVGIFDIHDGNLQSGYDENGRMMLRASSIKTFEDCQYKFFKQAIVKCGQSWGNSVASIIGTAVHYGVEKGTLLKIEDANCEPETDYMVTNALTLLENLFITVNWADEVIDLDFCTDYVDEKGKPLQIKYMTDSQEIEDMMHAIYTKSKQTVIDGVTQFNEVIMPDLKPIHAERRLTWMWKDNHPLFSGMSGSMDIEEENSVRDVKVTGKKQRVADHILQLSIYAVLRKVHNEPVDLVYIDNIIKNKTVKAVPMSIEPDIARVLMTVNAIKDTAAKWVEAREKYHDDPSYLAETESKIWSGARPFYFLCSPKWCAEYETCPHMQLDEETLFEGEL